MRTEESDNVRKGYDTKTGVGTRVSFGIENIRLNSKENGIGNRRGDGTEVILQPVSNRDGIGTKLSMRRQKRNDDRECCGTKTGVGTGVGFGTEKNRRKTQWKTMV